MINEKEFRRKEDKFWKVIRETNIFLVGVVFGVAIMWIFIVVIL